METTLCPSTEKVEVKQNMYSYTMEYHIPIKYKEEAESMQQNGLCLVEGHILLYFHLYDILAKVKLGIRQ